MKLISAAGPVLEGVSKALEAMLVSLHSHVANARSYQVLGSRRGDPEAKEVSHDAPGAKGRDDHGPRVDCIHGKDKKRTIHRTTDKKSKIKIRSNDVRRVRPSSLPPTMELPYCYASTSATGEKLRDGRLGRK